METTPKNQKDEECGAPCTIDAGIGVALHICKIAGVPSEDIKNDFLHQKITAQQAFDTMKERLRGDKFNVGLVEEVSKLHLPPETEEELGKVLEIEGTRPFKQRLAKHKEKRGRGIPANVYVVYRVLYDKTDPEDSKRIEILDSTAKFKDVTVPELIKEIVNEHI